MRTKALAIAENDIFQRFIIVVIILNAITIGLETLSLSEGAATALMIFDAICLSIYVAEIGIKLFAYRIDFFKSGWNIFDFVIVAVCLFPAGLAPVPAQVFRVLRVVRVFRVFRLVSAFKQMRVIVEAIGKALPGVAWTAFLLIIVYYVYAIIGVTMFGEAFPDWFGDLGKSFYSLYQVMTLESWSMGISRPVMEVYSWAWAYFVSFTMISAFIIINVVVGIIVNTIDEANNSILLEEAKENNESLDAEFLKLKEQLKKVELLLNDNDKRS